MHPILRYVCTLLLIVSVNAQAQSSLPPDSTRLEAARKLFYASVTDKKQLQPATDAFNELMRLDPSLEGRALTYIGALVALKGKHAFWPHDKLHWAKRGLLLMDQGVAKGPEDVEALFIHSSTCYFLPFFFNRGGDAQDKFKLILRLLPDQWETYDLELVGNVVRFISEKAHLDEKAKKDLEQLKSELGIASTS
jgi:hypothetical protein